MSSTNYILASIPLLFPAWVAIGLLDNPQTLANRWLENLSSTSVGSDGDVVPTPSVSSQLLIYSAMGAFGYLLTNRLIPNIKVCLIKVCFLFRSQKRNLLNE